jgi:hypothetical protein
MDLEIQIGTIINTQNNISGTGISYGQHNQYLIEPLEVICHIIGWPNGAFEGEIIIFG